MRHLGSPSPHLAAVAELRRPDPPRSFPERVLPKLRRAAMSAAAIEDSETASLFTATADAVAEHVAWRGSGFEPAAWRWTPVVVAVERLAERWLA